MSRPLINEIFAEDFRLFAPGMDSGARFACRVACRATGRDVVWREGWSPTTADAVTHVNNVVAHILTEGDVLHLGLRQHTASAIRRAFTLVDGMLRHDWPRYAHRALGADIPVCAEREFYQTALLALAAACQPTQVGIGMVWQPGSPADAPAWAGRLAMHLRGLYQDVEPDALASIDRIVRATARKSSRQANVACLDVGAMMAAAYKEYVHDIPTRDIEEHEENRYKHRPVDHGVDIAALRMSLKFVKSTEGARGSRRRAVRAYHPALEKEISHVVSV